MPTEKAGLAVLPAAKPQVVARSKEIDRLLKDLYPAELKRRPFCIIATGGYGQRVLCPYSDIDLLFLHQDLDEELLSQAVQAISYPLWDKHFEVGYRVCTLEEVLSDALKDLSLFTSLLSTRLVAGSRGLYRKFVSLFEERLISGRRKEIFQALKEARKKRLAHYQGEAYLLEPHLKEGLGGLRDYHFFLWVARIIFGLYGLKDMERAGLITPGEKAALKAAFNFLLMVREELHLLAGRKEDRLYFEYQPTLAVKLGFGLEVEAAIEKFMTGIYRAMTVIREGVEALFDHVEVILGLRPEERKLLAPGLEILSGRIHLLFREQALLDPSYLLQIFLFQAETGLKLHHLTRSFLKEKKPLKKFSGFEGRIFTKLLTKPHAYLALQSLRDTGVLLYVLPEFERLLGLTQFDVYHIHPLDEHLFLTVAELNRLREEEPDFWDLIEDEEVLFLAALLHDITKGQGPGHARTGAEKAYQIALRLGLSHKQAEQVKRLVAQHLFLVETALRRDLTEEKVVVDFARQMGDVGHLSRLYYLTVADSRATGPAAWNEWKMALVKELYLKAAKLLTEGELSQKETVKELIQREEKLKKDFGPLVETLPPCYLLHASLEEIKKELGLLQEFKASRDPLRLLVRRLNGVYRVVIITRDRPGLFAKLAGAFALHHLDIRSARIFTLTDGTVLDVFEVAAPYGEIWWEEIRETIKKVLSAEEEEELERRLKALKPLVCALKRPEKKPEIHVRLDNVNSDFFTIVEIFAPDKIGLLYFLAKALAKWPVNIERAFISNRADLASDVFYVRTLEGEKVPDEELADLKTYLERILEEICPTKKQHNKEVVS